MSAELPERRCNLVGWAWRSGCVVKRDVWLGRWIHWWIERIDGRTMNHECRLQFINRSEYVLSRTALGRSHWTGAQYSRLCDSLSITHRYLRRAHCVNIIIFVLAPNFTAARHRLLGGFDGNGISNNQTLICHRNPIERNRFTFSFARRRMARSLSELMLIASEQAIGYHAILIWKVPL